MTASLPCWVPSRRFAVVQGGKLRSVDDFSASGVNGTVSSNETVNPSDLDAIASHTRAAMDAFFGEDGQRSLDSPLRGLRCHPGHRDVRQVGRVWDLSKAYRQLARSPAHDSLAIIACFDTSSGKVRLFRQPSLAFGASASVLAFNWVALALCVLMNRMLRVGGTNFYDDFTILEATSLSENTSMVVDWFFKILAWHLKELPDFSSAPEPLGAVLHLGACDQGTATLANRPARTAEIVSCIDAMLASGRVEAGALRRLRGRLLHARAQCFGRFGGPALAALGGCCVMEAFEMNRSCLRKLRRPCACSECT